MFKFFLFPALLFLSLDLHAAVTSAQLQESSLSSLKSERYFDARTLTLVGLNLFQNEPQAWARFVFWRSHSLLKLGDYGEALRTIKLREARKDLLQPIQSKFEFFEHWIHLQSGD